tara:strand:+ start:3640 stop:4275 length:636 start_codon:yes stop_codon:yes gene_type:complete
MSTNLPKDLKEAELLLYNSLIDALDENLFKYNSINILFNNLRLNPIIERLVKKLVSEEIGFYLVWADEGASALAKRDLSEYSNQIYSFSKFKQNIQELNHKNILISIKPEPYDFDLYKDICELYPGTIIMINGRLEDLAVGIGNLGRERRKAFISLWRNIFWLQPLSKGAIMKLYKTKWQLFKKDSDGYRFCESFRSKPDDETILENFNAI